VYDIGLLYTGGYGIIRCARSFCIKLCDRYLVNVFSASGWIAEGRSNLFLKN